MLEVHTAFFMYSSNADKSFLKIYDSSYGHHYKPPTTLSVRTSLFSNKLHTLVTNAFTYAPSSL